MTSQLISMLATIGAMACLIVLGLFCVALYTEARRYSRRQK